jgi:tripartite-type tricarboxylate transporter receptor subunit TctC
MRIVVPFGPGGSTDIMGRALAQKLGERLGQTVIVENRAGANGTIGAAYVARAPGDARTMLLVQTGFVSNPFLYKRLPYDPVKDLVPVTILASGPLVMTVAPSLGAKTVPELVARANASPGGLHYASSGSGSITHLAAEAFNQAVGTKLVHVPYKGTAPAIVDVIRGQVPVTFMNLMLAMPYLKSGKLIALGVTTRERSPIAPELPTLIEGGLAGFDMATWYAVLVPSATPAAGIAALREELARAIRAPEVVERLTQDGVTVVASTPAEAADLMKRESARYEKLIRTAGIEAND